MRYSRRLFKIRRFPERSMLDPMLAAAGLQVLSQKRVPRIGAQVPVLVIGRPS